MGSSLVLAMGLQQGCPFNQNVVEVSDLGRQAVLMESPRAPDFMGPGLSDHEYEAGISYRVTGGPQTDLLRQPEVGASGTVVAMHTWSLRFVRALRLKTSAGGIGAPPWEAGLSVGVSGPQLGEAQAADVRLEDLEGLYFRGGLGIRGPIYHADSVTVGIVGEIDIAALPYAVDVARQTAYTPQTASYFPGPGVPDSTRTSLGEELQQLRGLLAFPLFRGGLYATYVRDHRLALTGGFTIQNVPSVQGVASLNYFCDRWENLDGCQSSEDYPLVENAAAGTAFGALHVTIDDFILSLRVQGHMVLESAHAPLSRVSGDLDVAYRF